MSKYVWVIVLLVVLLPMFLMPIQVEAGTSSPGRPIAQKVVNVTCRERGCGWVADPNWQSFIKRYYPEWRVVLGPYRNGQFWYVKIARYVTNAAPRILRMLPSVAAGVLYNPDVLDSHACDPRYVPSHIGRLRGCKYYD